MRKKGKGGKLEINSKRRRQNSGGADAGGKTVPSRKKTLPVTRQQSGTGSRNIARPGLQTERQKRRLKEAEPQMAREILEARRHGVALKVERLKEGTLY